LRVSGVYQNSFGGGKPHEYGTEKDFEGEIMGCKKDHVLRETSDEAQ
jgi:hypothetical protein